ncbi:MAG: hypothetical protein V4465_01745 [Patescibacteria group bacterium]
MARHNNKKRDQISNKAKNKMKRREERRNSGEFRVPRSVNTPRGQRQSELQR